MADNAVIHLIDDDDGVRKSLAFLLSTSGFAVQAYDSALRFLECLSAAKPGCIVTDVRMPGMNGLELQSRLKELGVRLPVIVITGHGDVPLAVQAMKAGAIDFIEKPFNDDVLLTAIRIGLDRHDREVHRETEINTTKARLAKLSRREEQVLEGLLEGHPNKTIAYDLGLSPRTVEIHRANVMTKMGANNLSELVRMTLLARGLGAD